MELGKNRFFLTPSPGSFCCALGLSLTLTGPQSQRRGHGNAAHLPPSVLLCCALQWPDGLLYGRTRQTHTQPWWAALWPLGLWRTPEGPDMTPCGPLLWKAWTFNPFAWFFADFLPVSTSQRWTASLTQITRHPFPVATVTVHWKVWSGFFLQSNRTTGCEWNEWMNEGFLPCCF